MKSLLAYVYKKEKKKTWLITSTKKLVVVAEMEVYVHENAWIGPGFTPLSKFPSCTYFPNWREKLDPGTRLSWAPVPLYSSTLQMQMQESLSLQAMK